MSHPARHAAPISCFALLAASCAHAPSRPLPFADSDAFHSFSGSIYGILEHDLDADGLPDAVVVQRVGKGYSPAIYYRRVKGENTTFERACVGPVVEGSDLDVLRFVQLGGGTLVLILASEETPDDLVQSFAIIDPADACASRLKERVQLPKPAEVVVAPGPVPAGVVVDGDGHGLQITDEPRSLTLRGAAGQVNLLARVRQRRVVSDVQSGLAMSEQQVELLQPRAVRALWKTEAGTAVELAEVVDGRVRSGFAARSGEKGELVITADEPFVAVELQHGCFEQGDVPLELTTAGEPPYLTGQAPHEGSFVLASGRSRIEASGVHRDFLLLREPVTRLAVGVGPASDERCIREVKAYGFR